MYICTLRGLSYPLPQKTNLVPRSAIYATTTHATQLLHDIGAYAFI